MVIIKSVLLLYSAVCVVFALNVRDPNSAVDTRKSINKRGPPFAEEEGRRDSKIRPPPVLGVGPFGQPHNGNGDNPSIQDAARTEPEYPYQEEALAQENSGKKDPPIGETLLAFTMDQFLPLARMFLGLDEEAYAKAIASNGYITAAKEGREYTARGSSAEQRERARRIGLRQYVEAQTEFGIEPVIPETWLIDMPFYQAETVELEDLVAVRRYKLLMAFKEILLNQPERLRIQVLPNTGSNPLALKRRSADGQSTRSALPPRPVIGGPLGQTLLEYPSSTLPSKRSKSSKRQSSLNAITSTVNHPNSTDAKSASFQTYLSAFTTAQSNVSSLLFPILDTMLNGTNSSIVYEAAWSIYSDLTGSSPIVIGPFLYGMHSLDWVEDQLFGTSPNISNMSASDQFARNSILAFHSVLLDLYYYAWDSALTAMNKTGLAADMTTLAGYMSTNDTAILGAYAGYKSPAYDSKYFTVTNETVLPDSAYKDLTA